jgi:hypothetical protein
VFRVRRSDAGLSPGQIYPVLRVFDIRKFINHTTTLEFSDLVRKG